MKQNFPLPPEAAVLAARLSGRQRECLHLVRNGLTSKEIGRRLSLSPSTVDNHLNAATEKLGCSSRAIAARILEMAEQIDGQFAAGNQPKIAHNPEFSPDATARQKPQHSYFLPPIGGTPNEETTARRIAHIVSIAIAATMAFAAITITVAGVIELFSK